MNSSQPAARSRDEVATAICALPPASWVRLRKTAARYAMGRPIEPDDLLQLALLRAVDSRICPANVDVVRFIAEAIRSIAGDDAQKKEHRLPLVPVPKAGDALGPALDIPDTVPSPEQHLIDIEDAARIREELLALFEDDQIARDILEGSMEELTPNEIQTLVGITETQYNSKRRFIRRRIDKAYPERRINDKKA